jgi:hypothetical protein
MQVRARGTTAAATAGAGEGVVDSDAAGRGWRVLRTKVAWDMELMCLRKVSRQGAAEATAERAGWVDILDVCCDMREAKRRRGGRIIIRSGLWQGRARSEWSLGLDI